jgi:hypothetical protein
MKTVIDIIHDDIQSRSDAQTSFSRQSVRGEGSRRESTHSSNRERKKGLQESKRMESFMADEAGPALASLAIEEGTSTTDSKRRITVQLNEFDGMFEGFGDNKPS